MITKYKLFENKNDVFEIGTKVICSKGTQDGREMGGAHGSIVDVNKNYTIFYIVFDYWPGSGGRKEWWVRRELIHLYDEDLEKLRQEKIERLRLKYKDIDPLGEEDWEEEED